MNSTFIGSVNILWRTSSLSPLMPKILVASFSVVMIIFGDGSSLNFVLMNTTSLSVKL